MKPLLYSLLLSTMLLACSQPKTFEEKEVYASETLEVYQLSEHVYVHVSYLNTESFGRVACNGMIVANQHEAVVFDTTVDDESSQELINWITQTLNAKIIAVIPAHYHDDNLGGLEAFHAQGIPSYALERTIEIAKKEGYPQPQHSFEKSLELKIGNEKVYADFLGEGHTCDNVIGYFPSEGIMFGGCLVKEIGASEGNLAEANVAAWPATIKNLKANYPDTKWIVPGHGKSGDSGLLDYTFELFEGK